MKCFVNFFKNDRLWQMLVALFFAVVLFFTAWSGNTQNKTIVQVHLIPLHKPLSRFLWILNMIVISTLSVVIPMMPKSI